MIPQPLKWVGAVVALVIFVAVVGPIAYDSLLDMVVIEQDSGLTEDGLDVDDEEALEAEEADDEEPEEDETPESYVVQEGDTLLSIAQEVYGDGSRWPDIAEANDIDDDSAIRVGEELVIP